VPHVITGLKAYSGNKVFLRIGIKAFFFVAENLRRAQSYPMRRVSEIIIQSKGIDVKGKVFCPSISQADLLKRVLLSKVF